jgi:iron(III) transport system ATP-binding protein
VEAALDTHSPRHARWVGDAVTATTSIDDGGRVADAGRDGDNRAAGVRIVNLQRRFGEVEALAGVSLDIRSGSFTTLLGPSGCGKSTTLRLIAGLDRPDGGSVAIGETVVSSERVFVPPQKRHVGFVFQSYALWPHMTVARHVSFAMRARGVPRAEIPDRVAEILQFVNLGAVRDRHPYELSGGQQQRVAVARALATDPHVLLLDEPLSNLDAELRAQMRVELRRVHDRTGLTTILVTHDQAEALSMSDEVVLMQSGKIVDLGSPRDLYQHPATLSTATFVGSSNILSGLVVDGVPSEGAVSIQLERSSKRTVQAVTRTAMAADTRVQLAIKPEDIEVASVGDRASGPNEFDCTVESLVYYGSHTLVTLRIVEGGEIELRAWADKTSHVAVGGDVVARIPSERILVLPADTPQGG